jgi:hypothetical protein
MGYKPLGSSHHDNSNNNLDFINYTQHHCAIQQHKACQEIWDLDGEFASLDSFPTLVKDWWYTANGSKTGTLLLLWTEAK